MCRRQPIVLYKNLHLANDGRRWGGGVTLHLSFSPSTFAWGCKHIYSVWSWHRISVKPNYQWGQSHYIRVRLDHKIAKNQLMGNLMLTVKGEKQLNKEGSDNCGENELSKLHFEDCGWMKRWGRNGMADMFSPMFLLYRGCHNGKLLWTLLPCSSLLNKVWPIRNLVWASILNPWGKILP